MQHSKDKDFSSLEIKEENLDIGKLDYNYVPPILTQGAISANEPLYYIKIEFTYNVQIGRVEISYEN